MVFLSPVFTEKKFKYHFVGPQESEIVSIYPEYTGSSKWKKSLKFHERNSYLVSTNCPCGVMVRLLDSSIIIYGEVSPVLWTLWLVVKPSFSIFVYSTNWVPTNKLYGLKSLFKIDIIIYQFIFSLLVDVII